MIAWEVEKYDYNGMLLVQFLPIFSIAFHPHTDCSSTTPASFETSSLLAFSFFFIR